MKKSSDYDDLVLIVSRDDTDRLNAYYAKFVTDKAAENATPLSMEEAKTHRPSVPQSSSNRPHSQGNKDSITNPSVETLMVNPVMCFETNQTLLHLAAANGASKVVVDLVHRGVDLNVAIIDTQWTPLFFAAFNGKENICRILVTAGANPRAQDVYGSTPLSVALSCGHRDVATFLERTVKAYRSKMKTTLHDDQDGAYVNGKPSLDRQSRSATPSQSNGNSPIFKQAFGSPAKRCASRTNSQLLITSSQCWILEHREFLNRALYVLKRLQWIRGFSIQQHHEIMALRPPFERNTSLGAHRFPTLQMFNNAELLHTLSNQSPRVTKKVEKSGCHRPLEMTIQSYRKEITSLVRKHVMRSRNPSHSQADGSEVAMEPFLGLIDQIVKSWEPIYCVGISSLAHLYNLDVLREHVHTGVWQTFCAHWSCCGAQDTTARGCARALDHSAARHHVGKRFRKSIIVGFSDIHVNKKLDSMPIFAQENKKLVNDIEMLQKPVHSRLPSLPKGSQRTLLMWSCCGDVMRWCPEKAMYQQSIGCTVPFCFLRVYPTWCTLNFKIGTELNKYIKCHNAMTISYGTSENGKDSTTIPLQRRAVATPRTLISDTCLRDGCVAWEVSIDQLPNIRGANVGSVALGVIQSRPPRSNCPRGGQPMDSSEECGNPENCNSFFEEDPSMTRSQQGSSESAVWRTNGILGATDDSMGWWSHTSALIGFGQHIVTGTYMLNEDPSLEKGSSARFENHAITYGAGDIVTVVLDFSNASIRFYRNTMYVGGAYLDPSVGYHPAITLVPHACMSILSNNAAKPRSMVYLKKHVDHLFETARERRVGKGWLVPG